MDLVGRGVTSRSRAPGVPVPPGSYGEQRGTSPPLTSASAG